jgi:REP element-mobilizing transposase RayT
MALPRSKYVKDDQEGAYHCFTRCVRRAFLCGFDELSNKDFSHRKALLLERLRFLAAIFAVEVCAYAIMANHYHLILRILPDLATKWSDLEVAARWLMLFPKCRGKRGAPVPPVEEQIKALASCPERIAQLRKRLSSLSWFMGRLNEFIARAANKEDKVKGRFWESRFKCQALLDEAAIAACMVYVDLNLIRAGLANTPEESDFTSIQERIRAWKNETIAAASATASMEQEIHSGSFPTDVLIPENTCEISIPAQECIPAMSNPLGDATLSTPWLCPIASEPQRRGILQMTPAEYFDLVDKSGRMIRSDKRGAIDADLAPILLRIGANPKAWADTVSRFGSNFHLAAGLLSNLRMFAGLFGRRWFQGIAAARVAFVSSPPQSTGTSMQQQNAV